MRSALLLAKTHTNTGGSRVAGVGYWWTPEGLWQTPPPGFGFWSALLDLVPAALSSVVTIAQTRYAAQTSQVASNADAMLASLQARVAEQERQAQIQAQQLELERQRMLLAQQQTAAASGGIPSWVVPALIGTAGAAILVPSLFRRRSR